jgi:hypothetical protein
LNSLFKVPSLGMKNKHKVLRRKDEGRKKEKRGKRQK